jgi:hypothetical protein
MDISLVAFNEYVEQKTILNIESTAFYLNNMVMVNAIINTVSTIEQDLTVYMAVVEKSTNGNVGTNGETDYYNVLMQMLPDANGTALGALEMDNSKEISLEFDMSSTFVEEMFDLSAIIFVQDNATKEVLQSTQIPILLVDNVETKVLQLATIYPNPFTNSITIDKLQIGSKLSISNIMGQLITTDNHTDTKLEINTEDFKPGIYIVKIIDVQMKITVKKIVKR